MGRVHLSSTAFTFLEQYTLPAPPQFDPEDVGPVSENVDGIGSVDAAYAKCWE